MEKRRLLPYMPVRKAILFHSETGWGENFGFGGKLLVQVKILGLGENSGFR